MALTVTVGRNVKGVPMDTRTWDIFQDEVFSAVGRYTVNYGGTVYFAGVGHGESEEWGVEDAYTLVVSDPPDYLVLKDLDDDLAKVGRFYGQEAVAVTSGRTRFV